VDVAVRGRQQLVCGRCLEPFERPYSSSFHFDYPVKDQVVLDVTDDVRQEVLLSYPLLVICKKECRGLCPACGKNLNEGSCSCNRTQSGKE